MKKNITIVMLLVACIFVSTEANATDLSGSFGVGYNTSVQSVSCRYFFGNFGINLLVGISVELQNVMLGHKQTKIDFRGTLYGLYTIEILDRANLNLFLGGEYEYIGSHEIQSNINFYARTGLSPEIFIFDNLSIETNFGLEFTVIESLIQNSWTIGFGMFGQDISIVTGFAFHWYFGNEKKENTESFTGQKTEQGD